MAGCEDFDADLSAYLDGELSATERMKVQLHLNVCQACHDEMAALKRAAGAVSRLPDVQAPASLAPAVMQEIAHPSAKNSTSRVKPVTGGSVLWMAGGLLAAATVTLAVLFFARNDQGDHKEQQLGAAPKSEDTTAKDQAQKQSVPEKSTESRIEAKSKAQDPKKEAPEFKPAAPALGPAPTLPAEPGGIPEALPPKPAPKIMAEPQADTARTEPPAAKPDDPKPAGISRPAQITSQQGTKPAATPAPGANNTAQTNNSGQGISAPKPESAPPPPADVAQPSAPAKQGHASGLAATLAAGQLVQLRVNQADYNELLTRLKKAVEAAHGTLVAEAELHKDDVAIGKGPQPNTVPSAPAAQSPAGPTPAQAPTGPTPAPSAPTGPTPAPQKPVKLQKFELRLPAEGQAAVLALLEPYAQTNKLPEGPGVGAVRTPPAQTPPPARADAAAIQLQIEVVPPAR